MIQDRDVSHTLALWVNNAIDESNEAVPFSGGLDDRSGMAEVLMQTTEYAMVTLRVVGQALVDSIVRQYAPIVKALNKTLTQADVVSTGDITNAEKWIRENGGARRERERQARDRHLAPGRFDPNPPRRGRRS